MTSSPRRVALIAAVDSAVAFALVVGAVLVANRDQIPYHQFAQFLSIRVTVLNAAFAVLFTILWKQCLGSLGLYRHDFTDIFCSCRAGSSQLRDHDCTAGAVPCQQAGDANRLSE